MFCRVRAYLLSGGGGTTVVSTAAVNWFAFLAGWLTTNNCPPYFYRKIQK